MIKIETKNGKTSIEAKGNNATLFADACVITKGIYMSLKDELSDKEVAERFKEECMNGSVFEEKHDDEEDLNEINKLLDDLIKKLEKLNKEDDDE